MGSWYCGGYGARAADDGAARVGFEIALDFGECKDKSSRAMSAGRLAMMATTEPDRRRERRPKGVLRLCRVGDVRGAQKTGWGVLGP